MMLIFRYFSEECDSLQGFQLLTDTHSGFGGLGVKLAELLSESYSSKTVLAFPVTPSLPDMTEEMRGSGLVPASHCLSMFLNGALTVHGLACGQTSALTTPMSVAKDTFPLLKTGTKSRLLSRLIFKLSMISQRLRYFCLEIMNIFCFTQQNEYFHKKH